MCYPLLKVFQKTELTGNRPTPIHAASLGQPIRLSSSFREMQLCTEGHVSCPGTDRAPILRHKLPQSQCRSVWVDAGLLASMRALGELDLGVVQWYGLV